MTEFYVIGAGDAGKDIRHTVEALNRHGQDYTILGYIDEDQDKHGQQYAGIEIKGGLGYLAGLKNRAQAICTIGDTRNKKRIVEQIGGKVDWINIIHPNASCAQDVDLGWGNYLYSFVTISRDVSIGNHCFINSHVLVGHDIKIGDYCSIQPGAMLVENVTLGPACYIGTGSILYGEITIGAGSIISAGSVVGSDVPENALVMGNPARVVRKIQLE